MCAGKDHLLRVGPYIIVRRYTYREHNVFGTPTGNRIIVNNGDPMPPAPRGFTRRRVECSADQWSSN
jgi:hypothetical protein